MDSDRLVAGLDQDLVDGHVLGLGERVDDRRCNVFGIQHPRPATSTVVLQRLLVAAEVEGGPWRHCQAGRWSP